MKVSLFQENFNKGLTIVSRSVASKATLPILANVLLATEEGELKLSATNLETGVNLRLASKIEEEGSITVPAKVLSELISSLPAGKVELAVKEGSLFVTSGAFKASFVGTSANEFPQIPSFEAEPILAFSKDSLIKALSQVVFAAAQDDGRPVLTGVLIRKQDDGSVKLVATDGYRLSVKVLETTQNNLEGDLLLPAKTFLEVSRLAQEKNGEVKDLQVSLTPEKSQVVFQLKDIEFSSRMLEGEFPSFERIIPQGFTTKAEFDKEEFMRAVKIAAIFAREQSNIVKFRVGDGKMVVMSETPQVGSNEGEIEAKTEGDKLEIAFNCRFLLDFLSAVKIEEIVFEASGSLAPGVFKLKGETSFFHIIMPVRLQG